MLASLEQHAPSDGATRLILVILLAGFVLVLLEAFWRYHFGRDADERGSRGRHRHRR